MNVQELQSLKASGAICCVDVRSAGEFRPEHLEGSLSLPLDELLSSKGALPDFLQVGKEGSLPVCLICHSGKRALRAQQFLQEQGVEVSVLEGGIEEWKARGGACEKSCSRGGIPLTRQVLLCVGVLNLLGLSLAYFVDSSWLLFPVFLSLGLIFAGLSGWCGLALLLARMPWNR